MVLRNLLLSIEVNSLFSKYLLTLESILNFLNIEIELRKLALNLNRFLLLFKLVVNLILHVVYSVVIISDLELLISTLKLLKLLVDLTVLEINTSDKLLEDLWVSELNYQVVSIESCFLHLTKDIHKVIGLLSLNRWLLNNLVFVFSILFINLLSLFLSNLFLLLKLLQVLVFELVFLLDLGKLWTLHKSLNNGLNSLQVIVLLYRPDITAKYSLLWLELLWDLHSFIIGLYILQSQEFLLNIANLFLTLFYLAEALELSLKVLSILNCLEVSMDQHLILVSVLNHLGYVTGVEKLSENFFQ